MKTGICTWSLEAFDIKKPYDYIDCAKELGFQTIDFSLGGYTRHFNWINASIEEIYTHFNDFKRYADEQNISFSQTHSPYALFPKYLKQEYLETQIKSIIITKIIDAKYMVMHPITFPLYNKRTLDQEEYEFNLEMCSKLTPYLKEHGVQIAIENIFDWDNKEIRNIQVSYPEGVMKYLDNLPKEHYVFCLDTGHLNIARRKQSEIIKAVGNRLKVLHVHDNLGITDQHILPGQGNIDWDDFTKALADINFDGVINLEIKPEKALFNEALNKANDLISKIAMKG